jgi:hypothetical protein
MSKSRSNRKHEKELSRRRKLAAERRRLMLLARKHEFPPFVMVPNGAPPGFVEAVDRAASDIDFRDQSAFQNWEREVLRWVKADGAEHALAGLMAAAKSLPPEQRDHVFGDLVLNLGQQVFRRIPEATLLNYIPFHEVQFIPRGRAIVAFFSSLKRAKGPRGTVYYSPHEPTVEVGGRKLVVAFSRHAIERTCARVSLRWPSFGAAGDAFALFARCLEFERCELPPGGLGFTFFDTCNPGFWHHALAQQVLGEQFVPGARYSYRVGYYPAVVEGRFLKATTLLFPGFTGTPEYARLRSCALHQGRVQAMLAAAQGLTATRLLETGDFSLLKWFQEQGVSQVRPGFPRYAPHDLLRGRAPGTGSGAGGAPDTASAPPGTTSARR